MKSERTAHLSSLLEGMKGAIRGGKGHFTFGYSGQYRERNATDHGVTFTRVGLENLLNPVEEDEVTEEPTLEALGR